jgi:hypothetical protein
MACLRILLEILQEIRSSRRTKVERNSRKAKSLMVSFISDFALFIYGGTVLVVRGNEKDQKNRPHGPPMAPHISWV